MLDVQLDAPVRGNRRVGVREGCRGAYGPDVGVIRRRGERGPGGRSTRGWRTRVGIALMLCGAVLAGCTAASVLRAPAVAQLGGPTEQATVLAPMSPVALAVATSAALYRSAPVLVLAGVEDADAQVGGASAAVALGAPMLLAPTDADPAAASALTDEVHRLGPQAVLAVGRAAQDWAARLTDGPEIVPAAPAALAGLVKVDPHRARTVDAGGLTSAVAKLDRARPELLTIRSGTPAAATSGAPAAAAPFASGPGVVQPAALHGGAGSSPPSDDAGPPSAVEEPPELPASLPADPLHDLVVLALPGDEQVAAVATARAAGVPVEVLRTPDPRSSGELVTDLSSAPNRKVLALGGAFGNVEQLQRRLAVVRTGMQLPGGGQLVFPGRRMVALYGTPGTPSLGALGEQDLNGAIARVKGLVAQYQPHSDVTVVPAFEIITTVASGAPGADGDYSNEVDIAKIRPYVDAAKAAGMYVVLDLQPGRTDFLTQAKRYEQLLLEPHVGLALDPEWRLKPGQVHRVQIGSVNIDEINEVGEWLAGLVREHNLPQKLLMLHQFRTTMIVDRQLLNTGHDELATLVHADGFGTQPMKMNTWNVLRQNAPNVFWGWKNFIDEDRPMLDPAQTMHVSSDILFVSYQ
jgi:hypothetical protein